MISIHALREEGDPRAWYTPREQTLFLSTPSARRATNEGDLVPIYCDISIHALREEGDLCSVPSAVGTLGISIHALREEGDLRMSIALQHIFISIHALREEGDLQCVVDFVQLFKFLSTPSARRATENDTNYWAEKTISIHALREEGDGDYFGLPTGIKKISIHALREEGDAQKQQQNERFRISIHALREEGDSKNREKTPCFCLIIHLPAQIAKRCL